MVRLIGQVFSIIFIKKKINIIQQVLFLFQGKFQYKGEIQLNPRDLRYILSEASIHLRGTKNISQVS